VIELSVVIPTLNRKEILNVTLGALFDQTYPKERYEVMVVDDGSTDGTEQVVRATRAKYLRQVAGKRGPTAANNLGIRNAEGQIILFMNDDVLASPQLIEEHMKIHKAHKNVIVQGKVINVPNLEDLTQRHKGYAGGYSDLSLGYFTTWNASAPKDLLIKAGLFDEEFVKLSWEDVEFGFRLRKMGIKQIRNDKAVGYHYKPPFQLSDLLGIRRKSIDMGHNGVLYYRKHPCLETKISVQAFFLPFAIHSFLSLNVSLLGKERIMNYFKHLHSTGQHKLLSFLVGLAGQYWYIGGVKQAWNSR
jgi:glycosyltransferase involved in cell wall biosynthesis